MKYIARAIVAILLIGLIACSNSSSETPYIRLVKIDYKDFDMYRGSDAGARRVSTWDNHQNPDSMLQVLVIRSYFSKYDKNLRDSNKISFEFLEDNMLSFIDGNNKNKRILSTYFYDKNNDLYVNKKDKQLGEVEPVFVAHRDEDGSFYRMKTVRRTIMDTEATTLEEEGGEETEEPVSSDKIEILEGKSNKQDLTTMLQYGDFADRESMKNPRDTIIWCNVKYIYR